MQNLSLKRGLLLLIILLTQSISIFGQQSTVLEFKVEKSQILKEKYPEKDVASDFEKIKVIVKRDSVPTMDFYFTVELKHITTSDKDVKLLNDQFVITKDDFHKGGNEISRDVIVEIFRDTTEVDKSDEVFELIIKQNSVGKIDPFKVKESEKITLTLVDSSKPAEIESPFRITTGANFDFEKTVKASLYFDAQLYKPIIFAHKKNDNLGLGTYASLYNNRYISSDSIQDNKTFHEVIGTGDTIDLVRYNYQIGASNSIKNIGVEAGLLYSFHSKVNKDSDVNISFILPEIGAISRNITTTYSYDKINQDTIFNTSRPDTISRLVEREFVNTRLNDVLFGVGIIFRYKSKTFGEFMMKASTGLDNTYFSDHRIQRTYYDFRFQILDPKVGINLGGEIRGFYGSGAPYFSVYLSKSFSLTKLTEM